MTDDEYEFRKQNYEYCMWKYAVNQAIWDSKNNNMLIPFNEILTKYNLKPKGVIHVGAWDGGEFDDYKAAGVRNVVFFEAQKHIMSTILGRIKNHNNAKAFNYCLSDVNGKVQFNVTSNGQSSSFLKLGVHKDLYPGITVTETIEMDAYTMKYVFDKEDLNKYDYDFVNMDVQGAELMVIKGMGDILHERIKAFYLEVNKVETYEGNGLVTEIDEYLGRFGFTRVLTGDWRGDAWTDALYLRQ